MRKMTKRLCTAAGVLFLAAALALAVSTSLARYRSDVQRVVNFYIRPSDQMAIFTQDEIGAQSNGTQSNPVWSRENGTLTLGFRVAGEIDPAKDSQPYCVRLYVDDGIPSNKLTVTLTANSQTYTGRASKIEEGSELYRELGPGYLYAFYLNGTEVQWDLQSAQDQETNTANESSIWYSRSFAVKVSGVGDAPVMTELCVESVSPSQTEKTAQTASSAQSSTSEESSGSEAASSEAQSTETTEQQGG